ncbi:DNA replication complex GINS protein PSF3 [Saguinus oedipus]|uniref:DNA replication complex GINS protein PSF3 n=1 Tax=Saguinus oedipus TaxID=9490 RepID=A0ABQ9UG70_SAGOE|nr:DNA replication complex GINS protein PSF3 [Saguinus oedipus]
MSEAYFRVESGALGPEENFLSLDDILMSHEKLPVRMETAMPRLHAFFLERSGGAETDNAKRWMLSVELHKIYQEGWRTVFTADANVVDLHKMGPHIYGFGSQLLHFDSPANADISQSLLQTFIGRFRSIMDSSQNAYDEDTSVLVARLDEMERGLFQTGQKGLNDFQCWEKRQASQITASTIVQNYKKRKFTDRKTEGQSTEWFL